MLNNSSYFSDVKSAKSVGGGLANRMALALSKEDSADLEIIVDEFNLLSDLATKLGHAVKICKILVDTTTGASGNIAIE